MVDFIEDTFNRADRDYLDRIMAGEKPHVVVLCGSTRFRPDFELATKQETLRGHVVLSVGLFGHEVGIDPEGPVKAMLDVLHLRKIDMSDEVIVINTGCYIGKSTAMEIAYAEAKGKPVRYFYSGHMTSRNK